MKSLLVISTLIFICFHGFSQVEIDDQIKYIRDQFALINRRSAEIQPLVMRSDTLHRDGPLEVRSWVFNGIEIKMQVIIDRKYSKLVTDYYFDTQGLIFAFSQEHLSDEFNQPYVLENRYYFKDEDTLVRWLDEDKKEVDPRSGRFSIRGNEVWSDVHWLGEISFLYASEKQQPSWVSDLLVINHNRFYDLTIGQKIESSSNLEKGILKTGEGDFEVYYIIDQNRNQLGYVTTSANRIHSIVVTTSDASTRSGLRVGSTFRELKDKLEQVEVHGSEVEGRTYISIGNVEYLLDAYFYSYDVDENEIPAETQVKAIVLRSPA